MKEFIPLKNLSFLDVVKKSFQDFISSGTSRSTKKLKSLHGSIATDLDCYLGNEYRIISQGFDEDKEDSIDGRYMPKKVDITIERGGTPFAGIGVKFVMQNYSQNSNNYFENMLGETANLRANKILYFQVFIILNNLPYYEKNGSVKKWETFTAHNCEKYLKLSQDNAKQFLHTPDKTLLFIANIETPHDKIKSKEDYLKYFKDENNVKISIGQSSEIFGSGIILNDYEAFIKKVFHAIKSV